MREEYYYHNSLATLSQDDLYSILWLGGIAGGVLFILLVVVITMKHISSLSQHRGDNLLGAILGVLMQIFMTSVFTLFFINFVYIVYLYGTQGSLGLNVAQSLEWFLHTDWLGNFDNLIETIQNGYGQDGLEIAKNTVASIYVIKFIWVALFFTYAILIIISILFKVNKIASENRRINAFEYSGTLAMASVVSLIVLVGTIALMNSAIDNVFDVSDIVNTEGERIGNTNANLQYIYLDALNPAVLSGTIIREEE